MAAPEVERVEQVADLLGGKKVLRIVHIESPNEMVQAVRAGLPFEVLKRLAHALGVQVVDVARLAGMSVRTTERRKSATLKADESDRIYRMARVLALATDVLGSHEKAKRWLSKPNRGLGDVKPLELLDTDLGSEQVKAALGRIEHGIFA